MVFELKEGILKTWEDILDCILLKFSKSKKTLSENVSKIIDFHG